MTHNFKKFIIALIVTSLFSIGIYFLVTFYDKSGTTQARIQTNLYYLIFLFTSIVLSLTVFGNNNPKSKLIITSLILINFLYIIFLFGVGSVGLANNQGYVLVGFLVLAFIGSYIKGRAGITITILSVFGIITIVSSSVIPLYEKGPNIETFTNAFSPKIITYSKVNIRPSNAYLQVDTKKYLLNNGLSAFDLKINNSGSQILFTSNQKYKNTFGFILFTNGDLVQIYPQSALEINKDYSIKIITGTVKYYPENTNNFSFTGDIYPSLIVDENTIEDILSYYKDEIKNYVLENLGYTKFAENKIVFQLSEFIVTTLSKILPNQFKDNINNLNQYKEYLNVDFTSIKQTGFDNKKINEGILKEISEALETTKIIK